MLFEEIGSTLEDVHHIISLPIRGREAYMMESRCMTTKEVRQLY
jgi:hypothetical protein